MPTATGQPMRQLRQGWMQGEGRAHACLRQCAAKGNPAACTPQKGGGGAEGRGAPRHTAQPKRQGMLAAVSCEAPRRCRLRGPHCRWAVAPPPAHAAAAASAADAAGPLAALLLSPAAALTAPGASPTVASPTWEAAVAAAGRWRRSSCRGSGPSLQHTAVAGHRTHPSPRAAAVARWGRGRRRRPPAGGRWTKPRCATLRRSPPHATGWHLQHEGTVRQAQQAHGSPQSNASPAQPGEHPQAECSPACSPPP